MENFSIYRNIKTYPVENKKDFASDSAPLPRGILSLRTVEDTISCSFIFLPL